jgi:cytochrome c-type biogenesis protein CcmH
MRRVVCLLFVLGLLIPCAMAAAPDRLADPSLEARAEALQKQLRCVVCQGESLDESNAPLAADLRHLIRAQLEKGWSDAQITNYLVARYGAFILMRPPFDPETYLLWLGPLITLLIGGAVAAAVIVRAHRNARVEEPGRP